MKTFKDIILEHENPEEIIKIITVDDSKIELRVEDFKSVILNDDLNVNNNIYIRKEDKTLIVTIGKINKNSIYINVAQECVCNGTEEIECPSCDGTGYESCNHCDNEYECRDCSGGGYIKCSCVDNPFDSKILYHNTISLNQFELF